jgi:NAD(P)-dependent dehydrogenase (short-subunit alcohol dehydrogenase family)
MTARKEDDGVKSLSELEEYGDLSLHPLDVSDPESIHTIANYIESTFGHLDILINNAGINYDTWQTATSADLNQVQETLSVNLFGAWRMALAVIPLMKKQSYGRIVNVSSGSGAFAEMGAGTPGYSISKAAMNVLTIKLASDLRKYNILVNSVCPGWVRTEMGGMAAPRSPQKGAETIIWAAELPDNGPTGKFFRDKREIAW